MRFWPIVLVLAALGACKLPGTTGGTGGSSATTGTTGTGGAGGASTCTTATTCMDCVKCALDTPCAALYAACEQDPDCFSIDQCFAECSAGDASCQANCYANNPNGMSAYVAVNQCVYCKECPTQCPGQCM